MNLLDIPTAFVLALPVAYLAWTISREELTRNARDWTMRKIGGHPIGYKLAYLVDCGYCLSPWISLPLCWFLDFRLFGEGIVSLLLTSLAVAWLSAYLQAVLASKL